jgi:hypothetical protein
VDISTSARSIDVRTIALTEPTCDALGLSEQPPAARDVAASALRLLESAADAEQFVPTRSLLDSLDELVVGVVEAVEECVVVPPREPIDLRARAEVEAARWVDDFLADDVTDQRSIAAQQAMFVLARLLADAVAEAVVQRNTRSPRPRLTDLTGRAWVALVPWFEPLAGARHWIDGLAPCRALRALHVGRRSDDRPVLGARAGRD